jgi:mono/diheme cytochrome c family protein
VRVIRSREFFSILAVIVAFVAAPAAANDPVDAAAAAVSEKYQLNVKKLFATKCSWCHQAYGMKQADGPKLAGTAKTIEQVMKQINEGKSPMPSFRNQLSEKEVQALAEYIKTLPAN